VPRRTLKQAYPHARMRILSVATLFVLLTGSQGFSVRDMETRKIPSSLVGLSAVREYQNIDNTADSRRMFLTRAVSSVALMGGLGSGVLLPDAATAVTGMKKVNDRLTGYGLPLVAKAPDGMSPLLEIYGKGKNRFPLLVQFNYPVTWVVTTPSNDVNGEDGTIQAGEYAKGDTATFFVYKDAGNVKDINAQPKELFEKTLMRAIGQKGDNMYQNFKVTKLIPTVSDGQEYMVADFKYQLLTGAGFEVDRKGVASITSQGDAVECLWSASTTLRWKKTEPTLRDIVASFRCYSDGLNFSQDLVRGLDA
jgi:hypothetical protein